MSCCRRLARISLSALAVLFVSAGISSAQDTRYIVKFHPGRSAQGQAALRAGGAQVVLVLGPQDAVAARIPAAALNGLSRNPNVEYIEEDAIREPYGFADVTTSGGDTLPYGIQMVQADKVTSSAPGNRKICIVDSGYSAQHEDLSDTAGFTGTGIDSGSGMWNKDSCGHGSHVAGTISAIAGNGLGVVGVDPGVQLHIVKVFGNDNLVDGGSCSWTYSSTLVAALNACTDAGSNVVSMSLGGSFKSRTEEVAFNTANKNGVLSIAAAGNAGNTRTSYPAGYASVMSVAAIDAGEQRAGFSQFNKDVEISAPGVAVLSTVPWNDLNTLANSSGTFSGGRMENAPRTAGVNGITVDGGQCTAPDVLWTGRVVLCLRGTNSFADKVKNVEDGGGVAAVIYNNAASDPSCGVFAGTLGDAPTTSTPAIALSCSDGTAALSTVGDTGTVVSQFTAPASSYEHWDGTSMATPHVSGVAALVWSCNPSLKNTDVRSLLTSTAKDEGVVGRDPSFGYGLVQAKAAVLALGGLNVNCTVMP